MRRGRASRLAKVPVAMAIRCAFRSRATSAGDKDGTRRRPAQPPMPVAAANTPGSSA